MLGQISVVGCRVNSDLYWARRAEAACEAEHGELSYKCVKQRERRKQEEAEGAVSLDPEAGNEFLKQHETKGGKGAWDSP